MKRYEICDNLEWCHAKTCNGWTWATNDNYTGIREFESIRKPDGTEIVKPDITADDIHALTVAITDEYDDEREYYSRYTDAVIIAMCDCAERLDCCDCPWRDDCAVMGVDIPDDACPNCQYRGTCEDVGYPSIHKPQDQCRR